jgi:hypothetical protein
LNWQHCKKARLCFRTAGGEDEISKLDAELKDGELLSQVSYLKIFYGIFFSCDPKLKIFLMNLIITFGQ